VDIEVDNLYVKRIDIEYLVGYGCIVRVDLDSFTRNWERKNQIS
jgi:hypothetical protein